ncbi:MAG: tetratricopeptide repeat protein [Bacteroidota bacterium]
MKKISLFIITLIIANGSFAQKVALQTAINWLNYDDLDKAKESIDQASKNESTAAMAKTWYYRGLIYHALYESTKEQFKPLKPGSLEEAYKAYEKTIELDTKSEYKEDLMKRINVIASQMQNQGVEFYRNKDYSSSLISFEKSISIGEKYLGIIDTLAIYNAALSADKGNNIDKAIKYYSKLIEVNYGGAKTFGLLSNLQMSQKDTTAALQTLKSARQKYPSDPDLSITELNIYLSSGRDKEAAEQIESAIVNDPKNSNLYFAKGVLNDKLGKTEVAIESYKKAIEIKPEHFDANYNLGAMLFNDGAEMINKANALPASKQKEYDSIKAKADARFKDAKPYFETAYRINPKDIATMQSLRQVYTRLNELEKAAEIKKAMDAIGK